jgi:hypothetical protein
MRLGLIFIETVDNDAFGQFLGLFLFEVTGTPKSLTPYSTVTLLARFLGWSTSNPRMEAI